MPLTREQTKYQSTNDTVLLPAVAVNRNLGVRGTSVFDNLVTINNGIRISGGESSFSGTLNLSSSTSGIYAGVNNGIPLVLFVPQESRSQTDNYFITQSGGSLLLGAVGVSLATFTSTASGVNLSLAGITSSGTITLTGSSPTITSTNASTASIFPSTVTGINIGSSTIKTVEYPADGTTASGATASGYMGMPRGNGGNAITGAYGITAADAGKHLYVTTTGQTITIPANGTTALPIGTTIVIINGNGVSTTIAITTDTLRQANTANTGSRTLASNGMATLVKTNTTEWIIGGNGLA